MWSFILIPTVKHLREICVAVLIGFLIALIADCFYTVGYVIYTNRREKAWDGIKKQCAEIAKSIDDGELQ